MKHETREDDIKTIIKVFAAIITCMFLAVPLFATAHHSMAEFDSAVIKEVEGIVFRVSWKNPHVLLEIKRPDENGSSTIFYLEASAVSSLRRRGITGDEIAVGDVVRIAGSPSTRRDNYILVSHILPPNGVELLVGASQEPRWTATSLGSDRNVLDAERVATAAGEGIFRVWSMGSRPWFFTGRTEFNLNQTATAAVAAWDDIADNPIIECIAPGMPGIMGNPYPMEFTQVGDNIELRFEEFDALRIIHMGGSLANPADVHPSHMGYSVGHWEGDTLFVNTSRVNWPYFNRSGAPQTENVKINERFTVQENGYRLEWILTVDEPASLTKPYVLNGYFVWRPGEAVNPYECTLEDWASTENTLTN